MLVLVLWAVPSCVSSSVNNFVRTSSSTDLYQKPEAESIEYDTSDSLESIQAIRCFDKKYIRQKCSSEENGLSSSPIISKYTVSVKLKIDANARDFAITCLDSKKYF